MDTNKEIMEQALNTLGEEGSALRRERLEQARLAPSELIKLIPGGLHPEGDEPARCRAPNERSGNRCGRSASGDTGMCGVHLAKLRRRKLREIQASPLTGRYSTALGPMRQAYESARTDPNLLDLRESIAILDVVVQHAAERAAEADVPEFRERATKLYGKATSRDPDEADEAFIKLGQLLQDGVREDLCFRTLGAAAERLARRQEKAWELKFASRNTVNAQDLMGLFTSLADIVIDECDKETAATILERFDRELLGPSAPQPRTSSRIKGSGPVG